jgi:hypothetical protein
VGQMGLVVGPVCGARIAGVKMYPDWGHMNKFCPVEDEGEFVDCMMKEAAILYDLQLS